MAKDELTGNMPTEKLISYFNTQKIHTSLDVLAFESAHNAASALFSNYL
jgi:hydroxymethylglutaryl-CoA lyase